MRNSKKLLSILLCLCMLVQNVPVAVLAAGDALCTHHEEHTVQCGYVPGADCNHVCGEACQVLTTACVHVHGTDGCSYVEATETEDASGECNHSECTVESGCVKTETVCIHTDHVDCSYAEGAPCTFDPAACTLCAEQKETPQWCGYPECSQEDKAHVTACSWYVRTYEPCLCVLSCQEEDLNEFCETCYFEGAEACGGGEEEQVPFAIYEGETGECIWNFDASTGILTISGNGGMQTSYSDTSTKDMNAPWKEYRSAIQTVVIKKGVTSIGIMAFYKCTALKTVQISGSVVRIGDHAFYDCSALSALEISDGVQEIGNHTFRGCSSLTSVRIPDGVNFIGSNAFYECSALQTVNYWGIAEPVIKGTNVFGGITPAIHVPEQYQSEDFCGKSVIRDLVITPSAPSTYTVTFDMNSHGTAIASQSVQENGKATKPADPIAEGVVFKGWYKDTDCTVAFDFDTSITGAITLYAKWETVQVSWYDGDTLKGSGHLYEAVNAVNRSEATKIKLFADINGFGRKTFDAGTTAILDLNGKTILRESGNCLYIRNNLTIQDSSTEKTGKLLSQYEEGYQNCIEVVDGGHLTIESGEYRGNGSTTTIKIDSQSSCTINGGKFDVGPFHIQSSGILTINGGTFESTNAGFSVGVGGGTTTVNETTKSPIFGYRSGKLIFKNDPENTRLTNPGSLWIDNPDIEIPAGYAILDKDGNEVTVQGSVGTLLPGQTYRIQKKAVNYTVTVTANPSEGGTITGAGAYEAGETVTLHAVPNLGYQFVNWTRNGEVVSSNATYTFTVTQDDTLVANFEQVAPCETHAWTFEAQGDTITATCTVCQATGSLTLKPPANLISNSTTPREATVEGSIPGVVTPEITYTGFGISDGRKPTLYGTYTASITIAEGVTASITFQLEATAVATITLEDGTVWTRNTLGEAISVANDKPNSTLTLLMDQTPKSMYWLDGTFTLDLNGYSIINSTNTAFLVEHGAAIIIKDSQSGGKIYGCNSNQGAYGGCIINEGSLTIQSGIIDYDHTRSWSGAIVNRNELIVTGGQLGTSADTWVILNTNSAVMTINGGTIKGKIEFEGNATIAGGTFEAKEHYFYSGTATISGGTFANGLNITYKGYGTPTAEIEITGGTFEKQVEHTVGTLTLKGGTFQQGIKTSADTLKDLLAAGYGYTDIESGAEIDGYSALAESTDPCKVAPISFVITIEPSEHGTVTAAPTAATAGANVTLTITPMKITYWIR